MTANEAMLKVAKFLADKYGYVAVEQEKEIDAAKDKFWGNQAIGLDASKKNEKVIVKACRYEMPVPESDREKDKRVPHIRIDMFWGHPRLSMYLPDGSFACIVYKDNVMSEAQAFKPNGMMLAGVFKFLIDEEIKNG